MPDFDVNEGPIDRRARCADALAHADAPPTGWHVRLTPRHDRLLGSPS
jgi:hypothetical protein